MRGKNLYQWTVNSLNYENNEDITIFNIKIAYIVIEVILYNILFVQLKIKLFFFSLNLVINK